MKYEFTDALSGPWPASPNREKRPTASFSTGPSEASALVAKIRVGERDAEEELFYRYRNGVAIIVRRIAKNADVAKDLSQDTFRLVLEKIRRGDLRDPEKLSGFICGIARNLAIEYLRRMKRGETMNDVGAVESIPDPAPDQVSLLLKEEKAHAIRQMLDELESARDRKMLYRFYLTDDDKEPICRDLGLSSLHFNRVLYRARERFRALYEKHAESEK